MCVMSSPGHSTGRPGAYPGESSPSPLRLAKRGEQPSNFKGSQPKVDPRSVAIAMERRRPLAGIPTSAAICVLVCPEFLDSATLGVASFVVD